MSNLSIPQFSLKQSTKAIAAAIESAKDGILFVNDLPAAPLQSDLPALLDHLAANPDLGDRLNKAYQNNLVYKDAYKDGKGGPKVDRKRVLDLSPERLEAIAEMDPILLQEDQCGILRRVLDFYGELAGSSQKISQSLATAIGSEEILKDIFFNYRSVDYYPSSPENHKKTGDSSIMEGPRCGEHRDFGSFTLIYTTKPGLQIFDSSIKEWVDVPMPGGTTTTAVLLFGWCTQIRSNGRIPAALHRVIDMDDEITTTRRTSAILFTAPKHCETLLTPVVRPGESPKYISNVQVGQLRGSMARKWQKREGTLSAKNSILEEEEILATNRHTQDDVVRDMVAVQN